MKKRKIIALATSFIMAFTIMVPLTSFAEEGTDQAGPQAVQEETPDADVTSGVDEETQPAAEADTAQRPRPALEATIRYWKTIRLTLSLTK